MVINIVKSSDPSIHTFCKNVMKEDRFVVHYCIEELKRKPRPNALIAGKIVKVLSYIPERTLYVLLIKQILPNYEYGIKFKAVLKKHLAKEFVELSPQTGDRVAFYNPTIFYDSGFEEVPSNIKKYVLVCETEESSFWFARKRSGVEIEMGGKSDDDKSSKQLGTTDARIQHRTSTGHTDLGNPKKSTNTKLPNPLYNYKSINSIKSTDTTKCDKVNFFAVIGEIIKPPTLTRNNKYHMMFKLVDDSKESIKLHVFLIEDQIIKQISNGDVIRLHRAKLETYNSEIDSRIFFSQDMVLFKKDRPVSEPLTTARNTLISDEEKRRVETLIKWYESEYISGTTTLLSNITEPKKYNLFCKVLACRSQWDYSHRITKVTVSDGSTIEKLVPSFSLEQCIGIIGEPCHIASEITVHKNLDIYANLKENDYVLFLDVMAVAVDHDKFKLEIRSNIPPEIVNERTPQVAEIESRIEEYLRKNLTEDSSNFGSINMTLPQTRQQKDKEDTTPMKNIAKSGPTRCDNRSCAKMNRGVLNIKDDCETRNSESDPGSKLRKPLFTPNYTTDLSDAATEETSENDLDVSKHKTNVSHEDVVNPASTNFNDIMEKVKTKYCNQKKGGQLNSNSPQNEVAGQCAGKKVEDSSYLSSTNRKRGLPEPQDDSDTETLVNTSLQHLAKNGCRNLNKRTRQIASAKKDHPGNNGNEDDVIIDLETREIKVRNWLNNPDNDIPTVSRNDDANEFRMDVIKQIIGLDNDSHDQSCLITSELFRVRGFLLDVRPDPLENPLDLVSGFCHFGCQKMFPFSAIILSPDEYVPLCPECSQLELEKETQLMFMMELEILELSGHHFTVLVMREQAEKFLNCTIQEFMKKKLIRASRSKMLTDFSVRNTYHEKTTPLLDFCVVYQGLKGNSTSAIPVLVDSSLKLPSV